MQQKTQGKSRGTRQQQALGKKLVEVSLQSYAKLEQGESATIISHSLLVSKLTAPMLLPHPTTTYPCSFKQVAALSTSLLSLCPSVINSASQRLPQPLKSKQAIPTLSGRECRKRQPQKRLDPFPWRQSSTQRISFCLQRVSSKPMLKVQAVNLRLLRLLGLRMSGLQTNLAGLMSMNVSCSQMLAWGQFFSQKQAGFLSFLGYCAGSCDCSVTSFSANFILQSYKLQSILQFSTSKFVPLQPSFIKIIIFGKTVQ